MRGAAMDACLVELILSSRATPMADRLEKEKDWSSVCPREKQNARPRGEQKVRPRGGQKVWLKGIP
jgi:hypothetical protein